MPAFRDEIARAFEKVGHDLEGYHVNRQNQSCGKVLAQRSRSYFCASTNRATSRNMTSIVLRSTGDDRQGRLLQYRTYSTHARSYKTTGRACPVTNRKGDIECGGLLARGSALAQARGSIHPRT